MNNKGLLNSVVGSVKLLEEPLTKSLRSDAVSSGWPEEIANYLSVVVVDDNLLINYPDELAKIIEDLEYGNGSDSPTPVMRRFLGNNQISIANSIEGGLVNHLFDTEVLP